VVRLFAVTRNISATLRLSSKAMTWAFVFYRVLCLLTGNVPPLAQELTKLHRVITLDNLRARFNIALDIGSSGFSAIECVPCPRRAARDSVG